VRFLLASESPRRVDLLRMAGYDFTARKSGFAEVTLDDPKDTVEANARGKALAVATELSGDEVVLAADTVVYLPRHPSEEGILGQAKNESDVRRMLGLLEGRVHEVYSGVAVARNGEASVQSAVTRVQLRTLSEPEVSAYAKLGEGVGKAGGYAIQGKAALFVERIEGDYSNVVGLPLALTSRMLEEHGVRWY
jgi:septum formation protein